MEFFQIIVDVGFPVKGLENRIKTMNNEVVRIDLQICHAFDIQPDLTVIARADGQSDSRKD